MKPTAWCAGLAAVAVALTSCSGDERDVPDVTEASTVASEQTTVPTTVAVAERPTVSNGGDGGTTTTATDTVATAPPVTCGPDPDETHPPPCD